MSLSEIESYVYGSDQIGHAITEFRERACEIMITFAPWPLTSEPDPDLTRCKTAVFEMATMKSKTLDSERPADLPWDIIWFDARAKGTSLYEFTLVCDAIEIIFESNWPLLQSQNKDLKHRHDV